MDYRKKEKLKIVSIVTDSFKKNNFLKVVEKSRLWGELAVGGIETVSRGNTVRSLTARELRDGMVAGRI